MRVLVLGAGGMGAVACRTASRLPKVASLTIADRDGSRAARLANSDSTGIIAPVVLDIADRSALRAALEDHDVVLNCVGPFYLHGIAVLQQAIESRCAYLDICDDWEPTLEMLDLDAAARARGVLAVVGVGASPGVTNMLALLAAQELDHVEEVLTGWSIDGGDDAGADEDSKSAGAAVVHWVQQLTGVIRVLEDGTFRDVKPLQRRDVAYPGRGSLSVWSVGHPEAVTLPRTIKGLHSCANVMVGPAESFTGLKLLADMVDSRAITADQAAQEIIKGTGQRAQRDVRRPGEMRFPPLFGWAKGRRGARTAVAAAHCTSLPPGGMGGATGVPMAVALALLGEARGARTGVLTPEQAFEPRRFLDALASHCVGAPANTSELVTIAHAFVDG